MEVRLLCEDEGHVSSLPGVPIAGKVGVAPVLTAQGRVGRHLRPLSACWIPECPWRLRSIASVFNHNLGIAVLI